MGRLFVPPSRFFLPWRPAIPGGFAALLRALTGRMPRDTGPVGAPYGIDDIVGIDLCDRQKALDRVAEIR